MIHQWTELQITPKTYDEWSASPPSGFTFPFLRLILKHLFPLWINIHLLRQFQHKLYNVTVSLAHSSRLFPIVSRWTKGLKHIFSPIIFLDEPFHCKWPTQARPFLISLCYTDDTCKPLTPLPPLSNILGMKYIFNAIQLLDLQENIQ